MPMLALPLRYARALVAVGVAVLLAACASTPTPYQPMSSGYGYSEQKLESNRYRITFAGNAATPQAAVENYVTYRAAQVTLQNGCDYFLLLGRSIQPGPGTSHGKPSVGLGLGIGSFGSSGGIGISTSTEKSLNSGAGLIGQADILIFKGDKPADKPEAMDAREVQANLRPTITLP